MKKKDGEDSVYWEEFLGVTSDKDYHEDRYFSTAVAVNALIDIWATRVASNKLSYDADITDEVK